MMMILKNITFFAFLGDKFNLAYKLIQKGYLFPHIRCFICYVFIHARLMCDFNKSMRSMSIAIDERLIAPRYLMRISAHLAFSTS